MTPLNANFYDGDKRLAITLNFPHSLLFFSSRLFPVRSGGFTVSLASLDSMRAASKVFPLFTCVCVWEESLNAVFIVGGGASLGKDLLDAGGKIEQSIKFNSY